MNMLEQVLRTYELTNAQVVLLADQPNPGTGETLLRGAIGMILQGSSILGDRLRTEPNLPNSLELFQVRVHFVTGSGSGSGVTLNVPIKDLLLTHGQRTPVAADQLRKLQTLSSLQGAVFIDFQNNLIGLHQECIKSLGYSNAHRVQFLISEYGNLLFLAVTDNAKPSSNTTVIPGFLPKMLLSHPSNSSLAEGSRRYVIECRETVQAFSRFFPANQTKVALDLIPGINTKRLTYANEPVTAFFLQERIQVGDRSFGSVANKVRGQIENYFNQSNLDTINSRDMSTVVEGLYQRISNIQ